MDNIKTYAVGNGEITLNNRDADELRYILQHDFVEYVVRNIIDDNEEALRFTSEKNRSRFVNEIVEKYDDLINVFGAFEEMIYDTIFEHAEETGVNA